MIKVGNKYAPEIEREVEEVEEKEPQEEDSQKAYKDEIKEEISNMGQKLYGDIQSLLKNFPPEEAPPGFENTELNDNEIQEVLSTLLNYQEKYFGATPLNGELVQAFVWNIPKAIYAAHKEAVDRCKPDMMDPIYWFYLFCMANPVEAMGKYLVQAINSMDDDEFDKISDYADEYDEM